MLNRDLNVHVAIISARRPERVAPMAELMGMPATWYVANGEGPAYAAELAKHKLTGAVVEAGALCVARNKALNDGFEGGKAVLELSDDMTKLERAVWSEAKGKHIARTLGFADAVGSLAQAAANTGTKLSGVAPTSNAFYYNDKRPVNLRGFIVGDMILVQPCDLRFDEAFALKEDYDYTLQHIAEFGGVSRVDWILASFAHRTNKGGAVAYRTPAKEQEAIALLKSKWGSVIQDNPKRPNEILLRLPKS